MKIKKYLLGVCLLACVCLIKSASKDQPKPPKSVHRIGDFWKELSAEQKPETIIELQQKIKNFDLSLEFFVNITRCVQMISHDVKNIKKELKKTVDYLGLPIDKQVLLKKINENQDIVRDLIVTTQQKLEAKIGE